MTLAQLRTLVTVIEAGRFGTAAAKLGMTQSAVSHALASLEHELGVELVVRQRGGSAPTVTGERILSHARDILRRHDHILQDAAGAAGKEVGKVRVGTPPSVGARLLPGALAAFRRRHASIDVIVFEGSDQEVDMWIRTRAVDVGVVMLPARGLETTELTSDEMVALVPAGHRYADRNHVRLRDLSSDPFIMSKGGCEPLIRDLYRASGAELDVHHEVREVPTIVAMVQEGLGVTIVPTLSLPPRVRGVRGLRLVPAARRRLAFALLPSGEAPPATKTFVVATQAWARQRFASDAHGRRALLPRP